MFLSKSLGYLDHFCLSDVAVLQGVVEYKGDLSLKILPNLLIDLVQDQFSTANVPGFAKILGSFKETKNYFTL